MDDAYQNGTESGTAHSTALVAKRKYGLSDSSVLVFGLNANGTALLRPSVFLSVPAFSDMVGARRFVLSVCIDVQNIYINSRRHSMRTAAGTKPRRRIHSRSQQAAWIQYISSETFMVYVCLAEEKDYESLLYEMLHSFRRQIDRGDFLLYLPFTQA